MEPSTVLSSRIVTLHGGESDDGTWPVLIAVARGETNLCWGKIMTALRHDYYDMTGNFGVDFLSKM